MSQFFNNLISQFLSNPMVQLLFNPVLDRGYNFLACVVWLGLSSIAIIWLYETYKNIKLNNLK